MFNVFNAITRMETTKTNSVTAQQFLTIALLVLLACFTLFSLDKDTHSFTDLFRPGNLFALVFYFTPTFLICLFFFIHFSKKRNRMISLILSLLTGIPLSFTLVICVFLLCIR